MLAALNYTDTAELLFDYGPYGIIAIFLPIAIGLSRRFYKSKAEARIDRVAKLVESAACWVVVLGGTIWVFVQWPPLVAFTGEFGSYREPARFISQDKNLYVSAQPIVSLLETDYSFVVLTNSTRDGVYWFVHHFGYDVESGIRYTLRDSLLKRGHIVFHVPDEDHTALLYHDPDTSDVDWKPYPKDGIIRKTPNSLPQKSSWLPHYEVFAGEYEMVGPDSKVESVLDEQLIEALDSDSVGVFFRAKSLLDELSLNRLNDLSRKAVAKARVSKQIADAIKRRAIAMNLGESPYGSYWRSIATLPLDSLPRSDIDTKKYQSQIQQLPEGKRKLVLENAIRVAGVDVPFTWGGKDWKSGFDSSGFAVYVLSESGVIEGSPDAWWTGNLKSQLDAKSGSWKGDIIFYDGGLIMFALPDGKVLGMTPKGIQISEREFGPAIVSAAYIR